MSFNPWSSTGITDLGVADLAIVDAMSLDIPSNRFAALNVQAPWRGLGYFPTGSVDLYERAALGYLASSVAKETLSTITADSGTYVFSGQDATLGWTTAVTEASQKRFSALNLMSPWRGIGAFPNGIFDKYDRAALSYLYAGYVGAIQAYTTTALSGSYTFTGQDVPLTWTNNINTGWKRFSAINIASPWRGINYFPTGLINRTERLVLANFYSGFAPTGATFTLAANSGNFVWDGVPSWSDNAIYSNAGAYAFSSGTMNLVAARKLVPSSGSFALLGNDADLRYFITKTLVAPSGLYTLTGADANFQWTKRTLGATAGTYVLTGAAAAFQWTRSSYTYTLVPSPGTYAYVGSAALLQFTHKLPDHTHGITQRGRIIFSSKHAADTTRLPFNFLSQIPRNEYLVSATVTIRVYMGNDPGGSLVAVGPPTIARAVATQMLTGGIAGCIYRLTCRGTTQVGRQTFLSAYLVVR